MTGSTVQSSLAAPSFNGLRAVHKLNAPIIEAILKDEPADFELPAKVRVIRPGMPVLFLRTVGNAIDMVQELPEGARWSPRWHRVEEFLHTASETRDPRDLQRAYNAFLEAAQAEKGWEVREQ